MLSVGAVGASLLPDKALPRSGGQWRMTSRESVTRKDGTMNKRILIAYATRCGSTAEVAEAIRGVLSETGVTVDCLPVGEVTDLTAYGGIVVGSAIRMARWLPEALDFVKKNRAVLKGAEAALFTVCLTMKDDTAENRGRVLSFMEPVLKEISSVNPSRIGLFGGKVDFRALSFANRSVLKLKGVSEGDFRNWPIVKAWAGELSSSFAS